MSYIDLKMCKFYYAMVNNNCVNSKMQLLMFYKKTWKEFQNCDSLLNGIIDVIKCSKFFEKK